VITAASVFDGDWGIAKIEGHFGIRREVREQRRLAVIVATVLGAGMAGYGD
jgi:hypothetical protein